MYTLGGKWAASHSLCLTFIAQNQAQAKVTQGEKAEFYGGY